MISKDGRPNPFLTLLLLTGSLVVMACSAINQGDQTRIEDKGDLKVYYGEIRDPQFAKWQQELQKEKVLEAIADDLNNTMALPANLILVFNECGTVNASYNPDRRRIEICYELIEYFYDVFSEGAKSEEELDDAVVGATVFTFYHELGHALVDVYDLPATEKEEVSVDQLSTFLLADGTDEGGRAALDGALSFYREDQEEDSRIDDLAFWAEHSLNPERFYNIVCWVYGKDEQKYSNLVSNGTLPEERAERCLQEYSQLARRWSDLLRPYLKN